MAETTAPVVTEADRSPGPGSPAPSAAAVSLENARSRGYFSSEEW
ncbi:hypothetical protein GCM10020295_63230 [Streptomyces cinereospinus]